MPETCTVCNGTGLIDYPELMVEEPCDECQGTGIIINDEVIEKLAIALRNSELKSQGRPQEPTLELASKPETWRRMARLAKSILEDSHD